MDGATSLVAATTGPVRRLTEAQRSSPTGSSRWGDMQSEMADMTKAIASQQRVVAEVLTQVLLPIEAARESLSPDRPAEETKPRSESRGSRGRGESPPAPGPAGPGRQKRPWPPTPRSARLPPAAACPTTSNWENTTEDVPNPGDG